MPFLLFYIRPHLSIFLVLVVTSSCLCLSPILYSPPPSVCLFCISVRSEILSLCSLLIFSILFFFLLLYFFTDSGVVCVNTPETLFVAKWRFKLCFKDRKVDDVKFVQFFRTNNVALTFSRCLQVTAALCYETIHKAVRVMLDLCFCAESMP